MEERGPPPTSPKYHNIPNTNDFQDAPPGTNYVVQVPKDRIYRTPPPENALIVERYQKAPTKKQSNCIKYALISIAIIVLLSGFIGGITLVVIKKDDPRFRVERVRVINTKGKSRQKKTDFDITLASRNPNSHTIISFDDHGKTALSFKDRRFAIGKFPSSEQNPRNSKDVRLILTSESNTKLPVEIRNSMSETTGKSQRRVEMLLEFRVPVKMKFGTLHMKSKTISVLCHVKVDNLAKNPRILSQDCDYSTRY